MSSKPSKEELIETRGFELGIAVGLERAAKFVEKQAGDYYMRRKDLEAELLREISGELHGMFSTARTAYDEKYPK